jgi:hypothetical protein
MQWMLLSGLVFYQTTTSHPIGHSKDLSAKDPLHSWRPPWISISESPSKALVSLLRTSKDSQHLNALHLDLNGYDIALNNCTTGHITFTKDDFITNSYIEYSDIKAIEGVGGTTAATGCESVKWMFIDKDDELHRFILQNVNYVLMSPLQLLSPQQLSFDV